MSNSSFPQLYSQDSKGKIRIWNISTQDDTITVTHGLQGGKQQAKDTVCKGKNIGKSNETTPAEQAVLEATSKHTKQIQREDYGLTPETSNKQVRPQLALDATKVGHRIKWDEEFNITTQPKIDGLRLVYGKRWWDRETHNEFMTRKGENYDVKHLEDACAELLIEVKKALIEFQPYMDTDGEDASLDGELYIHGLSLQKIVSYAKKYKKGLTEQLKYYLFDVVIDGLEFSNRYQVLENALEAVDDKYKHLFELVPCNDIETEDGLIDIHKRYLLDGYEGTMIRHLDSFYDIGKRSPHLFKYKDFKDCEVKIIEVWLDNNDNAMLTCELINGLICKVTPKRTHADRKQMYIDRDDLIGKWITVKFFDYTDDGNLQFPVGLDLRECNEQGEPIN